jgi:tetraacyldisaccharide 4'-kinase
MARLLAPLGVVTAALTARRVARAGWRAPVPVICVGNATVGGSGKTPLVLDFLTRLRRRGVAAHALTRGHGGGARGTLRVEPDRHDAAQVGDEALLLAAVAPSWVGADRAASARAAVAAGARALVMDDGLQNPGLCKDFCVLAIDGGAGFGNGFLLPAGPLRETVAAAAARCQMAVMLGADATGAAAALPQEMTLLQAQLVPGAAMRGLAGAAVHAFAGIGRPDKFFATLREADITLAGADRFADHHFYTAGELAGLRQRAAAAGVPLVTTTKDFVRLPAAARAGILPLAAELVWADASTIESLLAAVVR